MDLHVFRIDKKCPVADLGELFASNAADVIVHGPYTVGQPKDETGANTMSIILQFYSSTREENQAIGEERQAQSIDLRCGESLFAAFTADFIGNGVDKFNRISLTHDPEAPPWEGVMFHRGQEWGRLRGAPETNVVVCICNSALELYQKLYGDRIPGAAA